jgi:hypothetical protein
MRPLSKSIAWLCLLLTLWSAGAVVAHHHEDGAESTKCSVCVAALSTTPAAQTVLPRTHFVAVSFVVAIPVAATKQRLSVFALTVRPPPQG